MFLYSHEDRCIPSSDIRALAGELQSEGVQVTQVNFIDSPHVGHWDRYPDQYDQAVVDFLERIDIIKD